MAADSSDGDLLAQRNADLIDGSYDCVDRLVLNAHFSPGCSPGGFRTWWRALFGNDDDLDNEHLMRLAGRFSRRLRAWAKKHDVPVIDVTSEQNRRMHLQVAPHRPVGPDFTGVFCISVSRAPNRVWNVRRFGNKGLDLTKRTAWVNHYSFHIIDPEWGHMTIKAIGR